MTAATTQSTVKKSLTRQDQRNLEKLIEGDYRKAQSHIHDTADSWLRQRQEEIEAKYAELEKQVSDVTAEVKAVEDEIQRIWNEKDAELKTRGFESKGEYGHTLLRLPRGWQGAGKAAELSQARNDASNAQRSAERALVRAREDAMRGVYLAGIAGAEALELLSKIPSASEVFMAALPAISDDNVTVLD